MAYSDLAYGLDLLRRLNQTEVDGKPIARKTLPGTDLAVWQRFQQYLLFTDIAAYQQAGSFSEYKKTIPSAAQPVPFLKSVLANIAACLLSLLGAIFLVAGRPKNLIFSGDRISDPIHKADFRLASVYTAFMQHNESFVELLHSVPGKTLLVNAFRRGRPVIYLESIDALWYLWRFCASVFKKKEKIQFGSIPAGTDDEHTFITYIIGKYAPLFPLVAFRIKVLSFLFRISGVKRGFMIDDTRHYHEVAEGLRIAGITSYAIQHGHFTKYHVGWRMFEEFQGLRPMRTDYLLVWSDYWKQELLALKSVFPEEAVRVAGTPRTVSHFPEKKRISKDILVLIPHETDSPKSDVVAALERLRVCKGIELYFKLRPDVPEKETLKEYPHFPDGVRIIRHLSELPARPDVVAGIYSTFLYDLVADKIPAVILASRMDYGEGLVNNGLAEKVLDISQTCSVVTRAAHLSSEESARRAALLTSHARLEETITSILK
jgi:hypothetical protein